MDATFRTFREGGFGVGGKKPLGLKWASQDALRDDLSNEAGPT